MSSSTNCYEILKIIHQFFAYQLLKSKLSALINVYKLNLRKVTMYNRLHLVLHRQVQYTLHHMIYRQVSNRVHHVMYKQVPYNCTDCIICYTEKCSTTVQTVPCAVQTSTRIWIAPCAVQTYALEIAPSAEQTRTIQIAPCAVQSSTLAIALCAVQTGTLQTTV